MRINLQIALLLALLLAVASQSPIAHAAIFVDNNTSGCSNGSTNYSPSTRSCGAGSDTVYTTWSNANSGVSAGSLGNPTVINVRSGTDYNEAFTITKSYTTWQKYSTDTNRPVLDGQHVIPTTSYGAMISVASVADGVTIDNIEIERAGTLAVNYVYGIFSRGDAITITNCYIHDTSDSGSLVENATTATVQYNDIQEAGKCLKDGSCNSWGGAILIAKSTTVLVDNNIVRESFGEGILLYNESDGVTVSNNTVYDIGKPGIYTSGAKNVIIRDNIVYCTDTARYNNWGGTCGPSIRLAAEIPSGPDMNKNFSVYGNMTAGGHSGFSIAEIWSQYDVHAPTNVDLYNNTFVEHESYAIGIVSDGADLANVIKNNIFWQTTGTVASIPPNGATFGYNLWNKTPDSDAQASTDPAYSNYNTLSIGNYFANDFTSITAGSLSASDFDLLSTGAYAIDTGDADATYTSLIGSYVGSAPDMGAMEYRGTPQNPNPSATISSPSGPQSGSDPSSFTFNGSCTDADGDDVAGYWDFDGGATNYSCAEAATPLTCNAGSTEISGVSVYNVTLTCTDEHGAIDQKTVQITIGSPSGPTPYHEWDLEQNRTDDQGNGNLLDGNSITYSNSPAEPDLYGSYHAIFDGSLDFLYLSNASIGNVIGNGTDQDFTVCAIWRPDTLGNNFVVSLYDITNTARKWALSQYNGEVRVTLGYNDGASYNDLRTGPTFSAAEDVGACFSFDGSVSEYGFLVEDDGTYYYETENDQALSGSYNTGDSPDLRIGRDSGSNGFWFDGNVYWVRVYDEALTRAEMEAVLENTSATSNIARCFLGEDKTYAQGDTLDVYCDLVSSITVGGDGSATFGINDTASSELVFQTGNGSSVEQLHFSGTIPASDSISGGAEINAVSADAITLNSTTLDSMSDDVPTSGPGSIVYESDGYIDALADSIDYTCAVAVDDDTFTCTTKKIIVLREQRARMKICWDGAGGSGSYFNDGQLPNIAIPYGLDAGSNLVFQPTGYGIGTSCWGFESQAVESDMEDFNNIIASGTDAMVLNYVSGTTTIEDDAGNVASTTLPQTALDPTHQVEVWGTASIFIENLTAGSLAPAQGAAGSVTISP